MAVLGDGSGTGYPGVIDTAQTYVNITNPDPDDNTRADAAFANDVLAAILALENNAARLGVANTFTTSQTIDGNLLIPNWNYGILWSSGSVQAGLYMPLNLLDLRIKTNNTDRVTVLQGGNVGIGDTSPADRFVVNVAAATSYVRINADANQIAGVHLTKAGSTKWAIYSPVSSNDLRWWDGTADRVWFLNGGSVGIGMSPTVQLELSTSGAQKASGTAWTNPSDARLKENVQDYTDGLNVIMEMHPVSYELNGLARTPKGQRGIGVIAQEQIKVMPYTIEAYMAKLHPDDAHDTELYRYDGSAVTFALVNAVKELAVRVQRLEN